MVREKTKLRVRVEEKERRKNKNVFTEYLAFYSGELKYFKI
jgi:hypothetical protein